MTTHDPSLDTAIIFEGGAMRAVHGSGALVSLLEAGIDLSWIGGISAGATHALNYASRDRWRARAAFTDLAGDPRFGGWRSLARGDGFFNAQFIYQESGLPDEVLPFDWQAYQSNPAQVRIGSLNAVTGETVYWGRDELTEQDDVYLRVRASSTLPVMMPPVRIDGQVYVDGALGSSGGIALEAARADGYRRFLVVLSQPRGYLKRLGRQERLARRIFRGYPAVAESISRRPEIYNAVRDELFDLERAGDAYLFVPAGGLVHGTERNVAKLVASHEAGKAQARAEMPRIREFLGLV